MPVPGFQEFMLPMLELASDGKEHSLEEARTTIAARFNLTEQEQNELLPTPNRRALVIASLGQSPICNRRICLIPVAGIIC